MSNTADDDQQQEQQQENKITKKYLESDKNNEEEFKPKFIYGHIFNYQFDGTMFAFCLLNFFVNNILSLLNPFYAPLATEIKHLSHSQVGIIFGASPASSFIFAMIIGVMMGKWGRKKIMIISLTFLIVSIGVFGLVDLVKDKLTFFSISLLCRIVQGCARSSFASTTFAFIPMLWPNKIQKQIQLLESFTGLGMLSGPIIGSGLYTTFQYLFGHDEDISYQFTFYVVALLFFFGLIITIKYVPNDPPVPPKIKKLSYLIIFKNVQLTSLFFVMVAAISATSYVNPMLTEHLETYGMDKTFATLVFVCATSFYVLSLYINRKLIAFIDKKIIISLGLLLSTLGCEIYASEPYLNFPNAWYMSFIGQIITGYCQGMCILPYIPELMVIISKIYITKELQQSVSDISSGLFQASYSLGNILGPLVGGFIFDSYSKQYSEQPNIICDNSIPKDNQCLQYGFMWCSRYMALFAFIILIIFIIFGKVIQSWLTLCKKNRKDQISINDDEAN